MKPINCKYGKPYRTYIKIHIKTKKKKRKGRMFSANYFGSTPNAAKRQEASDKRQAASKQD